MARAQRFIIIGIVVAIIALAIYGYFTDQLPIKRGGGSGAGTTFTPGQVEAPRAASGQQFTFGAATYVVTASSRTADIGRSRTASGAFITIQLTVRNSGREPLSFTPASFQLYDRTGRRFSVDVEATRAAASGDRIDLTQATIQPGLGANGVLVFDVAPDATGLVLRLTQGYQDVALTD